MINYGLIFVIIFVFGAIAMVVIAEKLGHGEKKDYEENGEKFPTNVYIHGKIYSGEISRYNKEIVSIVYTDESGKIHEILFDCEEGLHF